MTEASCASPAFTNITSESFDKPWSPKGRFGRLSYLAWMLVTGLLFAGGFVIFTGVFFYIGGFANSGPAIKLSLIGITLTIALIYFGIVLGIRRLHDLNQTGWWMLILLLPFIGRLLSLFQNTAFFIVSGLFTVIYLIFSLYLIIAKGNNRENNFGAPRPTPKWEKICGWIYITVIPTIAILGIVAAIAIPAYQHKAKQAQEIEQSHPLTQRIIASSETVSLPPPYAPTPAK